MSGGLPPSIRVLSTVSWLEPMLSTWTAMPVACLEVGDRGGEAVALAAGPLRLDRDLLAVERLVGAERLVQLRVAGGGGGDAYDGILRQGAAGAAERRGGDRQPSQHRRLA